MKPKRKTNRRKSQDTAMLAAILSIASIEGYSYNDFDFRKNKGFDKFKKLHRKKGDGRGR